MDRTERIEQLKDLIKGLQKSTEDLLTSFEKADEAQQGIIRQKISISRARLKDFRKELSVIEMNDKNSTAFEWNPHMGMNRKQARLFRKNMNRIEAEKQRIKREHDNNKRSTT
jgi:hypothetical protein